MIPALLVLGLVADTLRVTTASTDPVFDGRATAGEWGSPSCLIQRPGGVVRLWLARWEESVYLAAEIEDSTYYWGDDLVISMDTQGDASPAPDHDDFQWYFRRMIDSSVVFRGQNGKGSGRWRVGSSDGESSDRVVARTQAGSGVFPRGEDRRLASNGIPSLRRLTAGLVHLASGGRCCSTHHARAAS